MNFQFVSIQNRRRLVSPQSIIRNTSNKFPCAQLVKYARSSGKLIASVGVFSVRWHYFPILINHQFSSETFFLFFYSCTMTSWPRKFPIRESANRKKTYGKNCFEIKSNVLFISIVPIARLLDPDWDFIKFVKRLPWFKMEMKNMFLYFFCRILFQSSEMPSGRLIHWQVYLPFLHQSYEIAFCKSCDIDFKYLTRSPYKWIAMNSIQIASKMCHMPCLWLWFVCYLVRHGANRTCIDSMSNVDSF